MKSPNKLCMMFNVGILACIVSNCANHPQAVKAKTASYINNAYTIDIDQGNRKLLAGKEAETIEDIEAQGKAGKDTPEVLTELLDLFEKFAQETIPKNKKRCHQTYIPKLIFYIVFIQSILSPETDWNEYFCMPSERGKMFYSCYYNAVKRLQNSINIIFTSINKQHPSILSTNPYMLRCIYNIESPNVESPTVATLRAAADDICHLVEKHYKNRQIEKGWDEILTPIREKLEIPENNTLKLINNLLEKITKNINRCILFWQERKGDYFTRVKEIPSIGQGATAIANKLLSYHATYWAILAPFSLWKQNSVYVV